MTYALVIGAGPAGLMAAEELGRAGHRVVVAEGQASIGRKFLMAGKSGLNLTKDQPISAFLPHYAEAEGWLSPMIAAFGPDGVQSWARELGVPVFTGSTGRVFPVAMKASPLLRAWLNQLRSMSVEFRTRWHWQGFDGENLIFDTPGGPRSLSPSVTVLALGGASWPRLGSTGAWTSILAAKGVAIAAFKPANMGFSVDWSANMARFFGVPVKSVALIAGGKRERGEFVVTAKGLEGGGIYALSRTLRDGAGLTLDLAPDWSEDQLMARLDTKGRDSLPNYLRKAVKLDPMRIALLQEFGRPLPEGLALARLIKALPARLAGPAPLQEAISVAGGITRASVTNDLELRAVPRVFAAGEMLDWEAPTGGYLLTACFATGRWAGKGAVNCLANLST